MRQRIAMLECTRGIAILGILLMNITAFGLPKVACLNSVYIGSISNGEACTWAVRGGLVVLLPRGTRWTHAQLLWLMGFGVIPAVFI